MTEFFYDFFTDAEVFKQFWILILMSILGIIASVVAIVKD